MANASDSSANTTTTTTTTTSALITALAAANAAPAPMQTLSSTTTDLGRFAHVSDRIRVHGVERPYDYVSIHSGVCILPIFAGKVCLLREYRYPIKSYQYQLPGGFIDNNENVAVAARRELYEETGLHAAVVHDLGSFYPSFGSTNEQIFLAAAECDRQDQPQREVSEVIETFFCTPEEVMDLMRANRFQHAAGLVALFKYFSLGVRGTAQP